MVETLMKKESNFKLSAEERTALIKQGRNLLSEYEHGNTDYGVGCIIDKWQDMKGWMIDLFRTHPCYIDGKYYIKLPATELKRPVDLNAIGYVIDWSFAQLRKVFEKKQVMIGFFTKSEYQRIRSNLEDVFYDMSSSHTWKGMTREMIGAEISRMSKRLMQAPDTMEVDGMRLTQEVADEYYAYRKLFSYLHDLAKMETPEVLSEESCETINKILEKCEGNITAHAGQKTTKFYGKIYRQLGIDKVVDVVTRVWTDGNGNNCSREVDEGYNKYRAMLGDAINPYTYNRDVYISVNPIDYWTSSFGTDWASCHTIDKENNRNMPNHYSGKYCGGTESYMLDNSTFVVYVAPDEKWKKEHGEADLPAEEVSKFKRCLFYMGEDKLFQSRVYPDGRDGGDGGIATQLRNIVQRVIAECYETNNMWTVKKGTVRYIETYSNAAHYQDYNCCNDCTTSFLRRINGEINEKYITVGAPQICPSCGSEHTDDSGELLCNSCRHINICYTCGEQIEEDAWRTIIAEDGTYFCCSECAEDANYVEPADVNGWYPRSECIQDDWTGEWYYYVSSFDVVTEEDRHYYDECDAINDGNVYSSYDDIWTSDVEDVKQIGDTDETFCLSSWSDYIETEDGLYFPTPYEAETHGYTKNVDDEWVAA